MDPLSVKVAALYQQAQEGPQLDEGGSQTFYGSPGGGEPSLPTWVPVPVAGEFSKRWNAGWDEAMITHGYDPGDDPLMISETIYDEASGFAIITDRPDVAKAPEMGSGKVDIGIVHWATEPIEFELGGKTYYLVGGISGV